jgi:tetratricopeptide (TPR) repeat protein
LERGVALSRQVGSAHALWYALQHLGWLHLAEGEWDAASQVLEECVNLVDRDGDLQALRFTHMLLAELDLLEGRPDAAHSRLIPLLDRPGLEEQDVTWMLSYLAWAHLGLGDLAEADREVQRSITRSRRQHHQMALVDALRVQAMVAIHRQHWDAAQSALVEGLALARRMPYPYAEGRLQHVYGGLCRDRGDGEAARERLEGALAIFQQLGARKDIERIEHELKSNQPRPGVHGTRTGGGHGAA